MDDQPTYPLLLAEDLVLLLLDDDTGALRATHHQVLLGGAVLADLALAGTVEVRRGTGLLSSSKVVVVPGAATPADPLLRDALEIVAAKERGAQVLVGRLGKPLKDVVTGRLVDRGLVQREDSKVLGLFPRTRWPATDSAHEDGVRRRLGDVLLRGLTADPRTASLVGLLHAAGLAAKVLDTEGVPASQVRKRAKAVVEELEQQGFAADAVRGAIAASQAAITAGVVAATAASSAGT